MKLPAPQTLIRIARWGMLAFFVYIVYHTFSTPLPPVLPAGKSPNAQKTADCNNASKLTLQDQIPLLSLPMIPTITPELMVQDLSSGTGEEAHCGQHVELRYEYVSKSGATIFSNRDDKATTHATLGDDHLLRGLELGMEGMQVGGTRRIVMGPAYAFHPLTQVTQLEDNARFVWKEKTPLINQEIMATATLLAVTPAAPVSAMPARVINVRLGGGAEVLCGQTVQAHISVWSLAGELLFATDASHPLAITLGQSQIPYGIEQAILGIREGTDRILVLPPALQQPLDAGKTPALVTLAGKETVLVEITLLSALKPTASSHH